MEWIRTADPKKFDIFSAFSEFDELYWKNKSNKNSTYNISVGDIVYLYVKVPYQKVMFKTVCTATNLSSADPEWKKDYKYWSSEQKPTEIYPCIKIKLISRYDGDETSLHTMRNKELIGENETIQGARRSAKYPTLFKYLNDIFAGANNNLTKPAPPDWIQTAKQIESDIDNLHLEGTERETIIKARVNQGEFRKRMLRKYKTCCLCNISKTELLIASHIKPWADCEGEERLNPDNGLLLCPNHDKLFDRGYISFDANGLIRITKSLSKDNYKDMNISCTQRIEMNEQMAEFMAYHREKFGLDEPEE